MVTIAVDLGARSPGNLAPFHHPGQFGHPRGFVLNGGLDVFLEAVGTVVAENTIFNTPGVSLYCLPTHHLKEQIRAAAHRRKDYCPEQRNPAEIRSLVRGAPWLSTGSRQRRDAEWFLYSLAGRSQTE